MATKTKEKDTQPLLMKPAEEALAVPDIRQSEPGDTFDKHGTLQPKADYPAPAKQPPTPLAIIAQFGADPNFDIAKLQSMVDLHERLDRRTAEIAYNEAMAACQAEIPAILKEGFNQHTQTSFAQLGPLIRKIKPVITKHGFSLSFYEGDTPKAGMIRCCCDIMHARGHTKTKWMDLPVDGIGAKGNASSMNPVQGVGSTHSYAQRYLTCDIFFIERADDIDGNEPQDDSLISPEQIEILNTLIVDSRTPPKKFMDWLQIDSLDKLRVINYEKAKQALDRNLRQYQEKNGGGK